MRRVEGSLRPQDDDYDQEEYNMEHKHHVLNDRHALRTEDIRHEEHDYHCEDEQGLLPIRWTVVGVVDRDQSLNHRARQEASGRVASLPGQC